MTGRKYEEKGVLVTGRDINEETTRRKVLGPDGQRDYAALRLKKQCFQQI
uniref:Uncharacterized protein n=1 Tax=Anguilla anguilla TaxID=7936 RepID=A0A0E9XNC7_ANGAN